MLDNLEVGDVVVLGKQYSLTDLFGRKVLKVLYEKAIVFYQKERFGDCAYAEATHVLIYVGGDLFFEVTDPVARYTGFLSLVGEIQRTGRQVWVLRYNKYQWVPGDSSALSAITNGMIGQKYAYIDIVPFILEKLLGFLPNAYKLVTDIFGGSWKKYMFKLIAGSNNIFLCSTGVAAIYAAMHKKLIKEGGASVFPRPFPTSNGDNEFIECVTPAHFGCWPGEFHEVK